VVVPTLSGCWIGRGKLAYAIPKQTEHKERSVVE
jgi:hypothetical protein